ncbi:MAG: Ig-like domain repeat protein, partial [Actinomycetota bacterium]|nr:Ig-like domain repeat protein [Actinomycetota bacterium]
GTSTYSGLADGTHQLRVRAKVGWWVDQIPATRSWTIDATPPDTTLHTPNVSGRDAGFTFSAVEGNGFQCLLSGPSAAHDWQPCSAPRSYVALADGQYTFEVRATDAAGNVDPSPASYGWTIDLTAPETTFGSGPADGSWVLSRSATLELASSESASTFACTLDGVGRTCGPASLQPTDLASGTHVATATATDAAGNTDATPASRTWTVPFDDTQLARSKGWAQKTARSAYLGTYALSTLKGATLTKGAISATKIALVATRAPGHGTVNVFLGNTLLKKVSLASPTVKNKQVIPVATFAAARTGTIKVVVFTAGKQVRIDGLGLATG